ncbi:unnamed protein product [Hyaloperonospora brassicae]|uniref:CCDC93 coiled-coil domain-containing protein n=1 Tax=Hyaloperonospora brassicae TaxID=162125 RepID=A0AAV0T6V1_HYABA|nr:unnamed protein product [Hyaloperonospora brassicae]
MFTASSASSSCAAASVSLQSTADVYDLAKAYGTEAADTLSLTLQSLETVGFPKAHVNAYSAFDRVMSGIAWLLHQIVRREDAEAGRVQWDVLFQPHDKMKPRLGLAQEIVRCVEALDCACPVVIQPHQLLLQDHGDIDTVQKLVLWLIDEGQFAYHRDKIRREKAYLEVVDLQTKKIHAARVNNDVELLLDAYAPTRRWRYVEVEGESSESEDALIQRCLLEYGEKVLVADSGDDEVAMGARTDDEHPMDIVAQMASQAAAVAQSKALKPQGETGEKLRRNATRSNRQAVDFGRHYQKAVKQAREEQKVLLSQRREREAKLMERVVSARNDEQKNDQQGRVGLRERSLLYLAGEKLKKHEQQVHQLIEEKKELRRKLEESNAQAAVLDEAFFALESDMEAVEAQWPTDATTVACLAKLQQLVEMSEESKKEKMDFRAKCCLAMEALQERIEKLRLQVSKDENKQEGRALRLDQIEQMHAQMAQQHRCLKYAASKQTRAVHCKLRQIDEIPSRFELVQYEKRFEELYDEVALTLDETRKYYCVFNMLKTKHDVLEKEISLFNSINENFEVAMGSKTATQAFFLQVENIIENVQGLVLKQHTARDDFQSNVDTLDSKYQLLLEQERMYANAIYQFQKECERNEKLSLQLGK